MHDRFFSCAGSEFRSIKEPFYSDSGALVLRVASHDNVQEFINSFASQHDIATLAARFMLGDASAVRDGTPQFGDFTNVPNSPAMLLNMMHTAKNNFEKLPLDTRKEFDNDFNKYFVSIFSPSVDSSSLSDSSSTSSDLSAEGDNI